MDLILISKMRNIKQITQIIIMMDMIMKLQLEQKMTHIIQIMRHMNIIVKHQQVIKVTHIQQ